MATSTYANNLTYVERELVDVAMVESPLYERLAKSVPKELVTEGGKYYSKGTLKVTNGWGARQSAEGGYRPTAYQAGAVPTKWELFKTWATKGFTSEEIETGDLIGTGPDGELNIKSLNLLSLFHDWAWHMDINLRGENTGRVTTAVGGGTTTDTLIVADARDFEIGMYIDGHNSGNALTIDSKKITAINYDTNTLTLDANATWTDGDIISVEDTRLTGQATGRAPYGLASILSDPSADIKADDYYIISKALATYGDVSRSSYPKFKATINQPAGAGKSAPFKAGDFHATIAKAYTARRVKPDFTVALCDPETAAGIVDVFPVNQRSMSETKVQVGESANIKILSPVLKSGSIEILAWSHFWRYCVAFLNEKDLKIRWTGAPAFKKDASGNIMRWQGNDAGSSAPDAYVTSFMVRMALEANPQEHAQLAGVLPGESFAK